MEPVDVSAPAAKDFAAIFNKVIAASEKAKITMKSQADKHRSTAPIYNIGDQAWLSTDNLRMLNRASKKLTEKWIGPYEISSVMPNAVELKLPKTLHIHPVVNISRVKPYLGLANLFLTLGRSMSLRIATKNMKWTLLLIPVFIKENSNTWCIGRDMMSPKGHGSQPPI